MDYQKESSSTATPQNLEVVQDGKKVIRPEVLTFLYQAISAAQLVKIRKLLERESSKGDLVTYNLDVTNTVSERVFRHPVSQEQVELVTATVFNDGPGTAFFSVNYPGSAEVELKINESIDLNFEKSEEKMRRIYYRANEGVTAAIRVVGKF